MKSPLEEKRDAIRELKSKLQSNISDEGAAQRTYFEQQRLAQKAGIASVEYILKDIAIQESNHAGMFQRAITQLDREESKITAQIESDLRKWTETNLARESDRRKKEDDERKKREEEQRKRTPMSEGYHGPYRLRR